MCLIKVTICETRNKEIFGSWYADFHWEFTSNEYLNVFETLSMYAEEAY